MFDSSEDSLENHELRLTECTKATILEAIWNDDTNTLNAALSNCSQQELDAEDKDGQTPLEVAVRLKSSEAILNLLVTNGASINYRVLEAVEECLPSLLEEYSTKIPDTKSIEPEQMNEEQLRYEFFKTIRRRDRDRRLHTLIQYAKAGEGANKVNIKEFTSFRGETLVQHACRWQNHEAARELIEAGVDCNKVCSDNFKPPLVEASVNGDVDMITLLTNQSNIDLSLVDGKESGRTALHLVTQKLKENKTKRRMDDVDRYRKCLEILVTNRGQETHRPMININAQDCFGNTALHYVSRSGDQQAVRFLLLNGADLSLTNILDETPLKWITPSQIESCMDECLSTDESTDTENISFAYSFLVPSIITEASTSNTDQSSEDHHLAETGQSTRSTVERNPECQVLTHLEASSRHRNLLGHPLVTSFLMLKFKKIWLFYLSNLVFHLLYAAMTSVYIYQRSSGIDSSGLKSFLTFVVVLLLVREGSQLIISWRNYLGSAENRMEITMQVLTLCVLFLPLDPDSIRGLSVVLVLLVWTEALLFMSGIPRYGINRRVIMFTSVCENFFYLLLNYLPLFVGFGLSFHVAFGSVGNGTTSLMHERVNLADRQNSTNDDVDDKGFGSTLGIVVKIISMMTGELESGSFPFKQLPFASHIVFVAFVFLMTVVLLNLLTGLAVSDIQAIQKKVEVTCLASQLKLIWYIETTLLGFRSKLSKLWPCRNLPKFLDDFFTSSMIFSNDQRDKTLVFKLDNDTSASCCCQTTMHRWISKSHKESVSRCRGYLELNRKIILEAQQRIKNGSGDSIINELREAVNQARAEISRLRQQLDDNRSWTP